MHSFCRTSLIYTSSKVFARFPATCEDYRSLLIRRKHFPAGRGVTSQNSRHRGQSWYQDTVPKLNYTHKEVVGVLPLAPSQYEEMVMAWTRNDEKKQEKLEIGCNHFKTREPSRDDNDSDLKAESPSSTCFDPINNSLRVFIGEATQNEMKNSNQPLWAEGVATAARTLLMWRS